MAARKVLVSVLLWITVFAKAQQPSLILPTGFSGGAASTIHFSRDEKKLYTDNFDALQVWDVSSGRRLCDLFNGCFEMSPDNRFFINNSGDTLQLWDANETRILRQVKTGAKKFLHAIFSPDGNLLASETDDSLITIRQTSDLQTIREWTLSSDITKMVFSGDNSRLVCVLNDRSLRVWNIFNGQELLRLPPVRKMYMKIYMPPYVNKLVLMTEDEVVVRDATTGALLHRHDGYRAAFSINYDHLFIATEKKGVLQTDIQTGEIRATIPTGKYNYINEIRVSPGNELLGTAGADNAADLWEIGSGKLLHHFSEFGTPVKHILFSRDGRKLVTASEDEIKIWQPETANLLTVIKSHTYKPWSALAHPRMPAIIVAQNDSLAKRWNLYTGQPELTTGKHTEKAEYAAFSPDGAKMVTVAGSSAFIREAGTGKLLYTLNDQENIYQAQFSNDSTKFLTAGYRHFTVWDLVKNTKVRNRKRLDGLIDNAEFSADGQTVITGSHDSLVVWWDAATGDIKKGLILKAGVRHVSLSRDQQKIAVGLSDHSILLFDTGSNIIQQTLTGHRYDIEYISWSNRGDRIVSAAFDNTAIIWDAATGTKLFTLPCGNSTVYTAVFSYDDQQVITSSQDNIIRIWNAADGRLVNSFFSVDANGFFNVLPGGYYYGSVNAIKLLHYVTADLKLIAFEQLDVKYNRPDKVLEAIGNKDTALIRSYRKAWEKRIKKLGIDTTSFRDGYSVPECDFVNRDAVANEQKNGILSLHIRGNDSAYKLDRFNIWVNESPLFGQRGISIRRMNSNRLDTIISINLSQGQNRIETSITNVNGTESYRMPLYVNYTPAVRQKESLRFIGIGIDRFANKNYNLQYSCKDIRDLAVKLKEKYKDDLVIDTLFNEQVTAENIKALKKKLQETTVNDKVIISYSGHGLLSKDYDYYLSTYAISFDKPEKNGLPYDELENLLDSIPARKKLMLIDACHSGEVDKEEMVRITAAEDSLSRQGTRGGKPTYTGKTTLGMKNSFELMQSLFVNVGKSTGATIISAAAGTQFALERGDLKNGVFTYCILEAMSKNPTMKISELKKIVGERVEQLTNGLQKPTSRNETIAVDWNL